jgi:hypothetical protein
VCVISMCVCLGMHLKSVYVCLNVPLTLIALYLSLSSSLSLSLTISDLHLLCLYSLRISAPSRLTHS